jgi:hypothetical protein
LSDAHLLHALYLHGRQRRRDLAFERAVYVKLPVVGRDVPHAGVGTLSIGTDRASASEAVTITSSSVSRFS